MALQNRPFSFVTLALFLNFAVIYSEEWVNNQYLHLKTLTIYG